MSCKNRGQEDPKTEILGSICVLGCCVFPYSVGYYHQCKFSSEVIKSAFAMFPLISCLQHLMLMNICVWAKCWENLDNHFPNHEVIKILLKSALTKYGCVDKMLIESLGKWREIVDLLTFCGEILGENAEILWGWAIYWQHFGKKWVLCWFCPHIIPTKYPRLLCPPQGIQHRISYKKFCLVVCE